jgi:hypothetical protein
MAHVSAEVKVDLDEFSDNELIDELESRGYKINEKWTDSLDHIQELLMRDQKEEALLQLSRLSPKLKLLV